MIHVYPTSQCYEPLRIHYRNGCRSSSLELRLSGEGVEPSVQLSPDVSTLDLGPTLAGDTASAALQVRVPGEGRQCLYGL